MKNFSAKNAEFETVTINNEAAISSADLGTAPNQIPLNKDLGSLAYQDAVNLDDVSADMLELRAIAAEISDSAVDVFVYDTSRDSDGGAWRKRTSHTSWYNEELNTATRGGRREFPAVAVIVAEADKVTIYDGDDPDLSMWMVFNSGGLSFSNRAFISRLDDSITSVAMLCGVLCVGVNLSSGGVNTVGFVEDKMIRYSTIASYGEDRDFINNRNDIISTAPTSTNAIINGQVNDVAMTVLPNAPIDDDTGLPVPTIAVATDGGVSVIKDDGTVVDIVSDNLNAETPLEVNFRGRLLYLLFGSKESVSNLWNSVSTIYIPDSDVSTTYRLAGDYIAQYFRYNGLPSSEPGNSGHDMLVPINSQTHLPLAQRSRAINILGADHLYIGGEGSEDKAGGVATIFENLTNPKNGLLAYTTSKYNTGWMPGDIKLATLSDTTEETIGGNRELVTNGGFDNDTYSGWGEAGSPNIVFSSPGVVDISGDGEGLYQDIAPGTYLVSVGNLGGTGGEVRFTDMNSTQLLFTALQSGDSSVVTSVGNLRVYLRASGGNTASFDNISVRATTELITNGDFSTNVTATDGETSGGWTAGVAGQETTLSVSNNQLTIQSSGSLTGEARQKVHLVAGRKYVFTVKIHSSSDMSRVRMGYDGYAQNLIADQNAVLGWNVITFTPNTTGESEIRIGGRNDVTSVVVSNVSIRPAEEDRSVNDNGLQIVGEINKTPVAPGADLVAYSGFSANDYLVQPYNEDLNFGTGDFSIMGWVKGTTTEGWLDWSDLSVSGSRISFYSLSPLLFKVYDQDQVACTASKNINDNTWHHIVAKRDNNKLYIYIDGVLSSDIPDSTHNLSNQSAVLKLGVNIYNSQSLNSGDALALWRISKTAPTAEQIAKIYRDEKPLFQEGAQATLYGSSDAVTALSYDEKTELLHVGTASGRSDFSGLRRINNTTTAITTSISTHNNLIAEQ